VKNDIAEGKVKPGQYFVLKFDFSAVERSPDVRDAVRHLKNAISLSFEDFYDIYFTYLGDDAKNLIDPNSPAVSLRRCVKKVNSVISKAREEGAPERSKPLADIQGVRIYCSLT
jgi:hypothetical protein